MQYSEKQSLFLDAIKRGHNIFLTGKAGTGKSFVVKQAMEILKKEKTKFIALAPTGIAAYNINGQTLHSMFGLSVNGMLDYKGCSFLRAKKRKVLQQAKVVFIDEISMLRPDVLDAVNWTLIKNGFKKGLAGKQVIFVGDMKQLPPPIDDNMKSMLLSKYNNYTFNHSEIYNKLSVEEIELDFVHRQSDPEFIENLNIVRDGGKSEYFKQFVSETPRGVVLAPHNSTVKKYNVEGLNAINSKKYKYEASISGKANAYDFNLEKTIEVKDGAKIMYLVNSVGNPLHNGTIGIFEMVNGEPFINVDGTRWILEQQEFTKKEYVFDEGLNELVLEEVGSIRQIPIKLAYALTIHKSQGLTFEEITLDLTKPCFAKGQLYTALSRVKSPEGLVIKIK